jgi:hypothetical protein
MSTYARSALRDAPLCTGWPLLVSLLVLAGLLASPCAVAQPGSVSDYEGIPSTEGRFSDTLDDAVPWCRGRSVTDWTRNPSRGGPGLL